MENIISMFFSGAVEAAAGIVVKQAFSSIINKRKRQAETQDEMQDEMQDELEVTLFAIKNKVMEFQSVIAEARERRIINPNLAEWLSIIINAAYLGDYIHRTFQNRNSLSSMIACEDTSDWPIIPSFIRAIKRMRIFETLPCRDDGLGEPSNVLKKLNVISVASFLGMLYVQPKIDRPLRTYLYMDHYRMFGREKEKEELMKFLLEPKVVGAENVDILPIVGDTESGKTTLALHCYYNPVVQSHFSQKIYIPSAYNEHVYQICRSILKQCSSGNIPDDDNTVVVMLKQNLSSERFLLVVDNFCLTDTMVWGVLWDCLRCGKEGSKVVLVTHSYYYDSLKKIVNIGRVEPIMVDLLPKDVYWLFFKEHAFGTADPKDYPKLVKIGEEIAERLGGSFRGAKILGSVLRDNLTTRFWAKVLDGILRSSRSRSWAHDGVWSAVETLLYLLPVRLDLRGIANGGPKTRSLRELMVVGPNHIRPTAEDRKYSDFPLWVFDDVSLSKCTPITVFCHPFWDYGSYL